MRRTYSYSKRESLETCARRYFYEYYAAAKDVPFDPERKTQIREMKTWKNRHLLAGEILHDLIKLRLVKGRGWGTDWFVHQAGDRFDRAVHFSRSPSRFQAETYQPPVLSEFRYAEPDAEETVAGARARLIVALSHFLTAPSVTEIYSPILEGEHLVEQKVSGLRLADYSIDGKLDLVCRAANGIDVVDWKIGEADEGADSLQLLTYGWWAGQKFGEPPERVRARKVFLALPEVGPVVALDAAVIRRGKARVIQDIQLMQQLDPFGRQGVEEAFTPCARANVCRQCSFRGTCSAGSSVTRSRPTSASLPVLQAAG